MASEDIINIESKDIIEETKNRLTEWFTFFYGIEEARIYKVLEPDQQSIIGDLVINVKGHNLFIFCTSDYETEDVHGEFRLRAKPIKLPIAYDFERENVPEEFIHREGPSNQQITYDYKREDVHGKFRLRAEPKKLQIAYDFANEINQTRQQWLKTEDPEEEEKAQQVCFDVLAYNCSYIDEVVQVEIGPWWFSKDFEVFVAYKLYQEIMIAPVNRFTMRKIFKEKDPTLNSVVDISFPSPYFAARVAYDSAFKETRYLP